MITLRRVALATFLGSLLAFAACSSDAATDTDPLADEDAGALDATGSDATGSDAASNDTSTADVVLPPADASGDAASDAPRLDGGIDAREVGTDADAGPLVVVTFDALANGTITPGHAGLGWDADWYVYNTNAVEYVAHSGTQFITNDKQGGTISFTFSQPVTFEGAWFSLKDSRNATVRFDVYDANKVKLGSSATLTQKLAPTFLPVGIAGVKSVTVAFVDDFAMDDVTYRP